jgi:hypothetical protein
VTDTVALPLAKILLIKWGGFAASGQEKGNYQDNKIVPELAVLPTECWFIVMRLVF